LSTGILMEMTIEEVRAFRPEVVVVGIGSVEPHGPALPYGTDYFICDATVRAGVQQANARGARALMYPTLPVGNNVNFRAWPFACRIRVQTLMQVLLDILQALAEDGARKIVIYNSHGGNTDTLRATLRAFADTQPADGGVFVCMSSSPPDRSDPPIIQHPSPHGGESETSWIMHLHPDLVRTDKLDVFPFGQLAVEALSGPNTYFVRPWHRTVPLSAGGDARESSAEKGQRLLEAAAADLAELLVQLSQAKWTEAFPFNP